MRRETDSMDSTSTYLAAIGRVDEIAHEELMGLIERAQAGDEKARKKCIEANLRLVVSIAREYERVAGELSLMDLVQEGNLGLMKTIDKFDTTRGLKFCTYASWWIRSSIRLAIDDESRTIRLTTKLFDEMRKVRKLRNKMSQSLGREPSEEELKMSLIANGWSGEVVNRILEAERIKTTPLQGTGKNDEIDEISVERKLADPNVQDTGELMDAMSAPDMDEMLRTLPERLRDVLKMAFESNQTLADIGRQMGVSRERARQLREKALKQLRERMSELFPDGEYSLAS